MQYDFTAVPALAELLDHTVRLFQSEFPQQGVHGHADELRQCRNRQSTDRRLRLGHLRQSGYASGGHRPFAIGKQNVR